jgi:zinc protease
MKGVGHLAMSRRPMAWMLAVALVPATAGADQPLRTRTGSNADVPQSADTGTIGYDVAGIHVIHRFAPTSEIVVANLYLLGGVRQVSTQNAGTELLLLESSERGTKTYARDQLRQAMARLGTTIVTSARVDWTSIGMRATRATFDSTWKILASRVAEPLLDSAEVAIVRAQLLAAVRQRQDSPDALVEFLADSFAFAGHPYALPPAGTEQSLARIGATNLRRYQQEQVVRSRMLLVLIGNIPKQRVERLVTQTLGRLPEGTYRWTIPDSLPHSRSAVLTVSRALPTNYILGQYTGPPAGSPDYQALRVATAVLSGQLFTEIRSRRNLTYAVDAPFVEHAVASGGLYVTTASPDVTMDVMRQQLDALKVGVVDGPALERLVQQFITQYFLENESAADQADFLARAQLYQGDFRAANHFADDLRRVTPEDIRRVAQHYIHDVKFVFLGDATKAPVRAMERY